MKQLITLLALVNIAGCADALRNGGCHIVAGSQGPQMSCTVVGNPHINNGGHGEYPKPPTTPSTPTSSAPPAGTPDGVGTPSVTGATNCQDPWVGNYMSSADAQAQAVKFCEEKVAGVDPSQFFPEFAVCAKNKLYVVILQDGQPPELVLLPPGTYSAAATGLPCTFKVYGSCQVSDK